MSSLFASLIFSMGFYLRDEFSEVIVKPTTENSEIERIVEMWMMYQDAIERLLGAPKDSIQIFTRELIESFFE